MTRLRACALFLLAAPATLAAQDSARVRLAILATEDLRPSTREGLAPILAALAGPDTVAQRLAVRALGRQERADLVPDIARLLAAPQTSVRAEAVNALGQAVARDAPDAARRMLHDRLGLESDPFVRGVLFRTLGRMRIRDTAERGVTERLLVQGSRGPGGDAPAATLEGVAHGLASLYRHTAASMPPSVDGIERLVELTAPSKPSLVRRLAMSALVSSNRTDSGALLDALRDPDWQVRRLAVVAAGVQDNLLGRERILRRALADSAPQVRLEALRSYGRRLLPRDGCVPVALALDDPDPQVQLVAIDLLAGCGATVINTLRAIANEPVAEGAWHRPAHALVALARVDAGIARGMVNGAAASPVWWVRMYAARAADAAADTAALYRLAGDRQANVREAALSGLHRLVAHAADTLYLAALKDRDYQLVRTAATALDSTPGAARAIPALRQAVERIRAEGKQTAVDALAALSTTLVHLGAPAPDVSVKPPAVPFPTWQELERFARTRATFVMKDGGRFTLRLFPFDAPTNVARFVRQARSGWFNGLTFHRVVPNFVVQGGSPGANEYVGDGPFTRDELGLRSNLRGTVGLSTRGRDTGDGQVFINLVDNIRLDHDYTVWGEVVDGMDVVDGLLEGALIERVIVEETP